MRETGFSWKGIQSNLHEKHIKNSVVLADGGRGVVCYPMQAIFFISKQRRNTGSKTFCI